MNRRNVILLTALAFVAGCLLGGGAKSPPAASAAGADQIFISRPAEGRRQIHSLVAVPSKTNADRDVVLGEDEWYLEINGRPATFRQFKAE